ncbi:peptidase u61 ld-carboxypeptidase a [Coniella lustricola]|uniref:Peptidase u61 ld-carboxypeptidase a n=1 Tax=Coniella lustricola TaxID=2025994 RepID=A0A2T2ZSD7_9PEZI|nr:peptidase u61 ld-carboxypeptidase a [Coniella lustricola]
MMSPVTPPALKPGQTIAFISPSARLNEKLSPAISRAVAVLSRLGYKVRVFFTPDTGIQSSIANRCGEIRTVFLDPSLSAVICTIGGETFTELLPSLIADQELCAGIRANPKIVVGSSDITGLHWFLYGCTGLRTFYGPSAIPELGTADSLDDELSPLAFCVRCLLAAITDPEPLGKIPRSSIYAPYAPAFFRDRDSQDVQVVSQAPGWQWLRRGEGQGRLFGGCLSVMARLNGVRALAPDWRGRIVFLETSMGESRDLGLVRMGLADLVAQGVFEGCAGLVIGRPYGYDSEERSTKYADIFRALLCEGHLGAAENQFPILYNVDIGHTTPMITLPFDALAILNSESDEFSILESGVTI